MNCKRLLLLALVLTAAPFLNAAPGSKGSIDYNRDIQPILSENCFYCHGPDDADRKADLRLDVREAAIEGGAIEPGDPSASDLIARILTSDADDLMPPPDSHRKLTQEQKDLLQRWIQEGAAYAEHWSFIPLSEPIVPAIERKQGAPPIQNPVDAFIRIQLDAEGIEVQPEASKETLLRRVSFDLTGLPPSPDEVEAFLADDSPGAYEKVVDRLLASPRYGERMAVDWLDLARYADTYGMQVDRDRSVWAWRDWVIGAFNDNLPYDQFVTWQLAGDLLPNRTDEQRLATTFSRLHQQKVEGGSTEEEFRVEYIADRVHTFGTAFLGLTLECSRCHDHKYDPITMKEYYQLFAFFDDIDEAGLYSFFTSSVPTPALPLLNDGDRTQIAELEAKAQETRVWLEQVAASEKSAFEAWMKKAPTPERVISDIPGEIGRFSFDEEGKGQTFANAVGEKKPAKSTSRNRHVDGRFGKALLLTGDDAVKTELGNFGRHQPFSASLWIQSPDVKDRAVIFHRSRAWTDAASRGYQLLLEDNRLSWSLIHFWPGNAISVRTTEAVPAKTWAHVSVSYDGSAKASGLKIYVNGQPAKTEIVRDKLTKNITGGGGDHIALGERFRDRGFKDGLIDEFRVFERELTASEAAVVFGAKTPPTLDLDTWLATQSSPYHKALDGLATARKALNDRLDKVPEIMVMEEMAQPKQAYILFRGAYDQRRDPVDADTPASLLAFPEDETKNRLGLARWLTQPDHPLTARTAVNRFWQACFGRGLVGTSEDFGSQGERPQYQDLLDWLAARYVASGWDTKALMKTIVMSHTYRQDSLGTPELMADDPENRLLARGPRHRLPAEMIRDNALAASGLLVEKIGGAPVRPYDLAESFKPTKPTLGEGLYRRSLYTYWKQTGPAPAMIAFDAVKRDVCSVKRETTSTPLQALILLNGPQFVEAARVLAERTWQAEDGRLEAMIERLFLALASRRPDAREVEILTGLYQDQLAYFQAAPEEAKAVLGVGHHKASTEIDPAALAATAMLAKTLLNFDESVVKR